MRATRSLRTAAIAAGVIAALAVPAGAAFADTPTPAASPSSDTQDKGGKPETKKEPAKDSAKPEPKPEPKPDKGKGKVAGINVGGSTMAELSHTAADGPRAVLRVGPEDAAAGFTAGHVQFTLTKKSPRFENNGQKFEIVKARSAKPQLKVTLEGKAKFYDFQAVGKGTGDKPGKPTPPKGGVKAGAEGVEASSGDSPVIAGSAGLAAIGAAGLGFAMVRRGRSRG